MALILTGPVPERKKLVRSRTPKKGGLAVPRAVEESYNNDYVQGQRGHLQ